MRHVAYFGGWKKLEPVWDLIIRAKRASALLPALESVLTGFRRELRVDRPVTQSRNHVVFTETTGYLTEQAAESHGSVAE